MMTVSFLLLTGICGANPLPALANAIPMRVSGGWVLEVGPGSVSTGERPITLPEGQRLEVPPPQPVSVRDEEYAGLPTFKADAAGWAKGARLRRLITEECSATGLLDLTSVRVKLQRGDAPPLVQGRDYDIDAFWATFGRADGGAIAPEGAVFVDYDYTPSRLDNILVTPEGAVRLDVGAPTVGAIVPRDPGPDEVVIARVFLYGPQEGLTDEDVFPVDFGLAPSTGTSVAESLLPKTLAKLRAGEPVTIVAWGDSVTAGANVKDPSAWYQHRFAALLKERFPSAEVTMLTAAWPGSGSEGYLRAPAGSEHEFVRDVLDPKPDLVTIEFVNDAYLDEEATQTHYAMILERLQSIGAEVVLIAPHLVRPDWMNVPTLKFDEDPRPYVKGLRRFASERHIALADASREWCRLWRMGIPYTTLLLNSINHPDERGHEIFAQALIRLFPER